MINPVTAVKSCSVAAIVFAQLQLAGFALGVVNESPEPKLVPLGSLKERHSCKNAPVEPLSQAMCPKQPMRPAKPQGVAASVKIGARRTFQASKPELVVQGCLLRSDLERPAAL